MKRIRFFGFLLILAALILALPGCDNGTADKDDDTGQTPVIPATYNGVVYSGGPASDGNYVFVSVYNVTARAAVRAAFSPQAGDSYAIAVIKPDAEGFCDNVASNIKSEGTVSVIGATLTFTPETGTTATGTLAADGTLTMAAVPGTSYTQFKFEVVSSTMRGATSANPFGPYGTSGFDVSDSGSGNGGGGTGNGSGGDSGPSAGDYGAGKVVKNITLKNTSDATKIFEATLTKQTGAGTNADPRITHHYYYEGQAVKLNAISFVVTYDDETTETVSSSSSNFIVDPPAYTNTGKYKLYYIGDEVANAAAPYEITTQPIPAATTTTTATFIPLKDIVDRDGKANPQKDPTAQKYYEDDYYFKTVDRGFLLTGEYDIFENDGTTPLPGLKKKDDNVTPKEPGNNFVDIPENFSYRGSFTGTTLTINIGSETKDFTDLEVYKVREIQFITKPFALPVLYDDPRLIATNSSSPADKARANAHWKYRIGQAQVQVRYTDAGTYSRNLEAKDFVFAGTTNLAITPPANLNEGQNPVLKLKYYNIEAPEEPIPVYNRLVSIAVKKLENPLVVNKEFALLKLVEISATYQMGSDRNKTITRGNILLTPNDTSAAATDFIDDRYINSSATLGTNWASIEANPNAISDWKNKGRPQKATFTFTSGSYPESATIEIGVN